MDHCEYKDLVTFIDSNYQRFPSHLEFQGSSTKSQRNQRQYYKKKSEKFFTKDGELYKHQHGSPTGVKVVCDGGQEAILSEFHSGNFGGHSGVNKTIDAIKVRYWWPGLTDDVKNYIKVCEKCQKSDPLKPAKKPELKQIQVSRPFELLGCDLMGPFHETEHGNRYIFTATDYYTKWVEAFPIPNKTAVEVSKCLKKILYRHGAVNAILTDQGREFMNQVNEHLCEEWKIKHKVTAAYHPQTNGLDERTNQTIKRALSKYVNEHQTDWDEWLDEVLFSLRTKPQSSTKYSPFFLLYGREAIYPSQLTQYFELEAGPPDCVSETALEEDLIRREADTEVVREKVRMNTEKAKAKQQVDFKRASQGKRKFKDISVGDRVLKFNSQRAGKKSKGDLNNNYSGPYIVSELNGNCARLMTIDKTHLKSKVNINHLKLFISEEEPETGEKASTENEEGRENTAAEGTNHEASYLLECVNSFIQEGVISQLQESVRNFKVAKPMSVRHSDDLLSCCPVYSFVSKMTYKYDDEIQIVARELLPTLRTENLSLSDKRDLTIILSCLCYQASKLHVSPMLLVGTLMNVPDHLSPVTDTAILNTAKNGWIYGGVRDSVYHKYTGKNTENLKYGDIRARILIKSVHD